MPFTPEMDPGHGTSHLPCETSLIPLALHNQCQQILFYPSSEQMPNSIIS